MVPVQQLWLSAAVPVVYVVVVVEDPPLALVKQVLLVEQPALSFLSQTRRLKMKQGRASSSMMGSTKQEPVSKAVNVSAVAQIGIKEVNIGRAKSLPMYEGRGLSAPMAGTSTHKAGSQGKR